MPYPIPTIGVISLGCTKALVDSERIITRLQKEGYYTADSYENANIILINTCGFIHDAITESLEAIDDALKQHGKVIVTGCLGAKKEMILDKYPQVLHITGPHSDQEVLEVILRILPPPRRNNITQKPTLPLQGIKLTPPHYAYLKISEGCNHSCAYCIIPQLRGKLISRPLNDIMKEAELLVQGGVKELLVISQDTGAYGSDLNAQPNSQHHTHFLDLIQALSSLGIWVRLHYLYPYPHIDRILPLMAENKILPYLDVPLQHIHPGILKLMKRPASQEKIIQRIEQWRTICPQITIRSTFIVGFPGETDEAFNQLIEFLLRAQLDRVGCFKYSNVEGAPSSTLPNHLPEEIKEERWEMLMNTQMDISQNKLQKKIGKTIKVLIDEVHADQVIARSSADSPEVDGVVFIRKDPSLKQDKIKPGEFATVIIDDAEEHDLWAHFEKE